MAEVSKIQWTDATWNPWHGCKKVSAGCKFCYMYRDKERYGQEPSTVLRSKGKFNEPMKWKEPKLVFTCSWSDWFIEEADEWRPEAWEIIKKTPHLTYQILTKRPERIADCLPDDWGEGYPNVWLGVSVESQEAVKRILDLSLIPAKIRFVSIEPLIGSVDLGWPDDLNPPQYCCDGGMCGCYGRPENPPISYYINQYFHWVIIGGESGNDTGKYKYRPCEIQWIENIMGELGQWGVPVFVKQLGTHLSKEMGLSDRHGGNIDEWPEGLKVREMPKVLAAQHAPN